jgi:hypothetical protein
VRIFYLKSIYLSRIYLSLIPQQRARGMFGLTLFSGFLAWHAHPPRPAGARRAPLPQLAGPWRHSRDSPTPAGGGHVVMDYEDFCVEAAPAADCADM